jgi:hypothetical protein
MHDIYQPLTAIVVNIPLDSQVISHLLAKNIVKERNLDIYCHIYLDFCVSVFVIIWPIDGAQCLEA